MVVVPAGSFVMGSPENEEGRDDDEGPQREVTIEAPYAVGRFEVTWDDWDACVAEGGCGVLGGDEGWGRGTLPVIYVSLGGCPGLCGVALAKDRRGLPPSFGS